MSPDYPYVIDRISLTENWSLHLPRACKVRTEDGAMVLWRSGFTMWVTVWGNDHGQSVAARQKHFAELASPDKFEEREDKDAKRLYYSYRLDEKAEDQRAPALYAFVFAKEGHLQLSFYFDDEKDAEIAYKVLRSVNSDPPALPDHAIYSQLCFASKMVMEDGMRVAYMVREEPDNEDDSGWRFFSGRESQEYVDDPDNIHYCPVALVAEIAPDIVAHLLEPPGSEFERKGKKFVSV